jgi:Fe-S cluster assembly protein SufD
MNAPVATLKTAAETDLARLFAASAPAGAEALRRQAFARVEAAGLPHRRIEAWHYTDLRAMMRTAAPLSPSPAAARPAWSLIEDAPVFTFTDGWLTARPALPAGVRVTALADDPATVAGGLNRGVDLSGDIVTSLNTAFMTGGLLIEVASGVDVTTPIALSFEATGATASYARVVVSLGAGASLTLVETHRGGAGAQTNIVVETILGEGATLEHVRVNAVAPTAQSLSTVAAAVAAGASFQTLNFTTGAALSRHQVFARVHGDDARKGRQHCDNTLVVEHDALRGESRELFRTVVDDEAKGVFQGKIVVKPHAQKTDGQMASNALLLGEHAAMHGKPELEIFADDVVCAHGMTVGALDDDLLFYLMSRGVPRKEAEGLMIQAFAGEALEAVAHEGLRGALIGLTAEWIAART